MKEIFEPIRQHYVFSQPCEELADYVDFFSESIVNDEHFTVEMFPSWTPTMYLNLGSPYRISLDGATFQVGGSSDVAVLRDCATVRHNSPGDRIFTIKFHPGGLGPVLGISQVGLKGKLVSLHQLLPEVFISALKLAGSFEERKLLAEQYLTAGLGSVGSDHYQSLVADIVEGYRNSSMHYNVSELAERYFLTSKTVNRYFHRVIGTSPKDYFLR